MALRFSHRSRPRFSHPLGFFPAEETAAECLAARRLGPLPLRAVVELCLRVKKLDLAGTFTQPGGDPLTYTQSIRRRDFQDLALADERAVSFESIHPLPVDSSDFLFSDVGDFLDQFIDASGPTYVDENGDFWLTAYLNFSQGAGEDAILYSLPDDSFYAVAASASLVLASGTFAVTVGIPSGCTATLTLTASEWFAYATTTGAAAWSTSTGAPANGGPGA